MLNKLMTWFFGYLYVRLKGYSPERFINLCNSKKIYLWNVVHIENEYSFCISLKNYKKLKPIAKKSGTVPYIKKRVGFPFYLHRYKKRQGFLFGFLICAILVYILSLYIWNIEIKGGYKYTEGTILQYLDTIDVYSGMRKNNVNGKSIEEKIRITYPDIGWVSAEVRGTRLIIKIEETSVPQPAKEKREPSHMVATKSGIVTSIITRSGTPKVKIGDVVKKGDILVSGIVTVIGDNDTIVNQHAVVADADIILKSFYEYKDKFQMKYIEKNYTTNVKKGISLLLFDKKIISYKPRYSYENYDIINDNMSVKITDSFYLPVELSKLTIREYNPVEKIYSEEEAKELAEGRMKRYIDYLTSHGVEILENRVEIHCDKNFCQAYGKLIVKEAAWEYDGVNESMWRFENIDESN